MAQANTFYLISILKRYSDKDHPLSVSAIHDLMKAEFFVSHPESCPHHITISRSLDALMASFYAVESEALPQEEEGIFDPLKIGFQIVCQVKDSHGNYVNYIKDVDDEAPLESRRKKSPICYYYYQSLFDASETLLLIAFLEATHFFSAEDTRKFVSKLSSLSPLALSAYEHKLYNASSPRLDDSLAHTLEYIKIIREAIQKEEFLRIVNGYYNENHELVPRYSENDDAYSLVARPVEIVSSNGNYYLIAVVFSTTRNDYYTIHYRIDRLCDVEPFSPTARQKEAYKITVPGDAAEYRLRHPSMFGDEQIHVKMSMLKTTEMLNVIMDYFGKESLIEKDPRDPNRVLVRVCAAKGGLKRFLKEFCDKIQLLTPLTLAEELQSEIAAGLSNYQLGKNDLS